MTTILSPPESYTLLTGATGSIGAYLLQDLLRARLPVAVLVRGGRQWTGVQRIERLLSTAEAKLGRRFLRPKVLQGDLRQPDLGLVAEDLDWLKANCGRVLHSAASLSFAPVASHPENEPFQTNLHGTENLLRTCRDAFIQEFHYVSTAYTCGLQHGTVPEALHAGTQQFANDYELSKCRAEHLLSESSVLKSLTIYRPSIVIDPVADAGKPTDQAISKAFSTWQLLCSRFGIPQPGAWLQNLGLSGTERKNIVSANWVARTIVQILRRPQLHGSIYHLTSAQGTTVQTLEEGFRQATVVGQRTANRTAAKTDWSQAAPGLIDKLAAPYVATFLPYFRNDPVFDQTNLNHALKVCHQPLAPQIGVEEICTLTSAESKRPRKPTSSTKGSGPRSATEESFQNLPTSSHKDSKLDGRADTLPDLFNDSSKLMLRFTEQAFAAPTIGRNVTGPTLSLTELVLSGSGGGRWTVHEQQQGITVVAGHVHSATRRIYTSAVCLEALLSGEMSLDEALSAGLLVLEDDDGADCCPWAQQVLFQLQRLARAKDKQNVETDAGEVIHAR